VNIPQMLDELSEFQSQVEYLALKKQELLDEVKIPVEVLAAQDETNKARQAIDSAFFKRTKDYDQTQAIALAEVKDPELPPEYRTALDAANKRRTEIMDSFAAIEAEDQRGVLAAKAKLDTDLQSKIADVYHQVALRKQEIDIEFSEKAGGANDNIAKLTAEIKQAVKDHKSSVKGKYLHAIYVNGRVTWNTDMLDGMIVAFPALEKARKVGEPSITIRKI